MTPRSALFFVGFLAFFSTTPEARAQGSAGSSGWDTSVLTGLFIGHPVDPPDARDTFDDWYHSGALAVTAGRYLTPNLKAEGELMTSGEGQRYVQRFVDVPGVGRYPIGSEHMVRTNGVSGSLVWQFLENQWVHPFVFAGAELDFDRTRVRTWAQSYYRGDPFVPANTIGLTPERREDLGTTTRVRGVIGTGAKLYLTPRTFFRTDARVGIGGEPSGHVAFRLGLGLDF